MQEIDKICGEFEAGSNILALALSMRHAEQLAYALCRSCSGEYAIVLSTNERASEVVDAFKAMRSDKRFVGVIFVGVIDAITKSSMPTIADTPRLMFVSSPTNFTGIRIKFSNMIETIFEGKFSDGEAGFFPPPIRFCVNSTSTLLMYRRLDAMYQFFHVLTAKLKKTEGFGVYLVNSESFDNKTISIVKQLMTGVIERKAEGDAIPLSVMGIWGISPGISPEWTRYTLVKGQVTGQVTLSQ